MALSRIKQGMIATGAVTPSNLQTGVTFTVNALGAVTVTATNFVGTSTTLSGDITNRHQTASGNIRAASMRVDTSLTATTLVSTDARITSILTASSVLANSAVVGTLGFTSQVGTAIDTQNLTVRTPISNLTVTNFVATTATIENIAVGTNGLLVKTLRSNTSTYIAYYNTATGEVTYGSIGTLIPSSYDQSLNTTDVVRFAGVTATSITIGGVKQTTAWTGTVASSQITAVSTSKVTGLSVVGYTNNYSDLSNKPTSWSTSTITGLSKVGYTNNYNDLDNKPTSWSTSTITGLSKVGYTNNYNDLDRRPTNQLLFTTSTVTFKTMILAVNTLSSYMTGVLAANQTYGTLAVEGNAFLGGISKFDTGMLIVDVPDGLYLSDNTDLLLHNNVVRPAYLTSVVDIGDSTHRINQIYGKNANFTATVFADKILPYNGGSTWVDARGYLGDTNFRWKELWAQSIYTQSTITGGSILTDSVQFSGDNTYQYTAWTGTVADSQITSVSTSKVTGLSIVGYTGNYNDLSNKPAGFDLSTVTNQALFTTSTVQFGGLTVSTGSKVTQVVSAGGYPLDINGQALLRTGSTQSSALVVSNWTSGLLPTAYMRGYGQNRPGNSSTTAGAPSLTFDGSRGTNSSPTALQSSDTVGALSFGGYDGTAWTTDRLGGTPNSELNPFQFVVQTTENWAGNATTATNVGTRMFMRAQPTGVRLDATSRQIFMINSWTAGSTATNTPPTMFLGFGSGVDNSAPTLQPSGGVGSYNTGYGHTKVQFINSQPAVIGVPAEATTAGSGNDNPSLTATNLVNFVSGRRSGASGRRDALLANDGVGGFNFYAQTATGGTGFGSQVGGIYTLMQENAGSTARGTRMIFQTVTSGTTTISNRLYLSDRNNYYNSDSHGFYDKTGTFPAVVVTTSTAVFTAIPVLPSYTATAIRAITGQAGAHVAISDNEGKLAYWNTANARWEYIKSETAV